MGEIKVLNPIPRLSSLKEAVIKTIRDAIITGHFKPGEKLIEKRLTEDLGVSRTILREAISHLSAEGIVRVVPNKGPIVRNFEETDIYNLYQIRMALLGLSARQFTQNMTEKSLLKLEKKLEKIKLAHKNFDDEKFIKSKNDFYQYLVDESGNDDLILLLRSLESQLSMMRSLGIKHPKRSSTRSKISVENLQATYNMIQARNYAEAERMIRAETLQAQKEIVNLLREQKEK